ncbi:methyl-accepting chemotaxis protein [Lachnospiraceae bacterium ZAX-1]
MMSNKRNDQSISKVLISITATVTAIGLLLLTAISVVSVYDLSKSEEENYLAENAQSLANKIDGWIIRTRTSVAQNAELFFALKDEITHEGMGEYSAAILKSKDINGEYLEVYCGWLDGTGTFGTGWEPDSTWDARERPWYQAAMDKPGETLTTPPYYDAITGALAVSFVHTIGAGSDEDTKVIGVASIDVALTTLIDMVTNANDTAASTAFIIDSDGNIIMHPDEKFAPSEDSVLKNLGTFNNGQYKTLYENVKKGVGLQFKDETGNNFYVSSKINSADWYVVSSISMKNVVAPVVRTVVVTIVVFAVVLLLNIIILAQVIHKLVVLPIKTIAQASQKISNGITDVHITDNFNGLELKSLVNDFNHMIEGIRKQSDILETIAGGDYTKNIDLRSDGDILNQSINDVVDDLNVAFSKVGRITSDVKDRSVLISASSTNLSKVVFEQAATVQEISAAVDSISQQTADNTAMAKETAKLSTTIMQNAEKGNSQMQEMTDAIHEINAASQSISKVIKVIDDIAFQTNILSLNAAIEASRAGEAGKGFAVVADEVRNLAGKCAVAASETGILIKNSMEKAEMGVKIAMETAVSLGGIISTMNESTTMVSHIAESSVEQGVAIEQINLAVGQIADGIQQTSGTSQENAAHSEELDSLAKELDGQINKFQLKSFVKEEKPSA